MLLRCFALLWLLAGARAWSAGSERHLFLDMNLLANPAPSEGGITLGYNPVKHARVVAAYGELTRDSTSDTEGSETEVYRIVGGGVRLIHDSGLFAEGFGSYALNALPSDLDTVTGSTARFQPAITIGYEHTFSFGLHIGFGIELISLKSRFEAINDGAQKIFDLLRSDNPFKKMGGFILAPVGVMAYVFTGGFQLGWAF